MRFISRNLPAHTNCNYSHDNLSERTTLETYLRIRIATEICVIFNSVIGLETYLRIRIETRKIAVQEGAVLTRNLPAHTNCNPTACALTTLTGRLETYLRIRIATLSAHFGIAHIYLSSKLTCAYELQRCQRV